MKMSRLAAVARKEFLHVRRDVRSLGLAIGLPMFMIFLFGYALSLDVDNVPISVWDQDHTPQSRDLISRFQGSRYFRIEGFADNYPAVEQAIDSRRTVGALIIPPDFARNLNAGRQAPAQFILDGGDSNTATIAQGYATALVQEFNSDIQTKFFQRQGQKRPDAPLDYRPRVWFNADLESRNQIIPGLIAVIMMVIAALLTSLTFAREWENGTMEQIVSTPLRGPELVIGKLLPYFAIGMLDVAVAVLMGEFVFHVPLRGSVVTLFALSAVFLVGALCLGMFFSIMTRNQLLSSQLSILVTYMPTLLLSGFMYAISNMPTILQVITNILPARHFIFLLKAIYLKGLSIWTFPFQVLYLAAFGLFILGLCIRKFRKNLE